MATSQEVEMLRRQLDELTAQMIEMRQQSSSSAMNAAVSGLAEAVRTMGQSVSKPRLIQQIRGYTRSCPSCLAEHCETITNSSDGDSTTRTAVCNIAVPPHDAHTDRSTESGEKSWKQRFEAYRQLCLMHGTSDQEGSTGLFVHIMTYKFGSKI